MKNVEVLRSHEGLCSMDLVMRAGKPKSIQYTDFSTGRTTREFGVRFPTETEYFLFNGASYQMGTVAFSQCKTAWSEAGHLRQPRAEINPYRTNVENRVSS